MQKRLGEANWKAFVKYAETEYKEDFFRALTPASGMLCCEGNLDGEVCPKEINIDLKNLSSIEVGEKLSGLHMDHTHDVSHICDVWSKALPEEPKSWDDGVCGALVAHLLFGTRDHILTNCSMHPVWRRQLIFRCGNVRGANSQHATHFCHDVAKAHYEHALCVEDIQWPVES